MKKYAGFLVFTLAVASSALFGKNVSAQTYTFQNNLTIGSRGQDVANLQSWLISQGYTIPSISSGATQPGYFGAQTAFALSQYQRSIGVPAYGYFGPITRARIVYIPPAVVTNPPSIPSIPPINNGGYQYNYPNGYPNSGYPNNNTGPLRVTTPNGGESWQKGTIQAIRWTAPQYFVATYAEIRLTPVQPTCTTQVCPMYALAPYIIASGLSINQGSYNWTVGDVDQFVGSNSRTIAPDGRYTIQICTVGGSTCDSSDSAFTIYSLGNNGGNGGGGYPGNQPPTIYGVDAPTQLAIGQAGTWTVRAADPENGTLSYSVDWGDQPAYLYQSSYSSTASYGQSTSFTHSYANSGTYTITFTVRDNTGLMAQSKTTIFVGVTSQPTTFSVTSPNGGETWKRGTQKTITWNNPTATSQYNYNGTVRITLDYRCPPGLYCTALYHPQYIIQNSAPNSGSSYWNVGSVTTDGYTGTTAPSGTYIVTVCRYDGMNQPTVCDSSDSTFSLVD